MSDEIFEVATSFVDVAELGQGYVDRADGERMLLALSRAVPQGEGVRFIVHLGDGTPAFAGAGRCVQVSDQGKDVPADERYETLLDSLVFDERSQPVYEYIVAVRQIAYANLEPAPATGPGDEAVYESEESSSLALNMGGSGAPESLAPVHEVQAISEHESHEEAELAARDLPSPVAPSPAPDSQIAARAAPAAVTPAAVAVEPQQPERVSSLPPALATPESEPAPILASVVPEPLPTGILTRAALAAHWVPAAARPPQRSMRPGIFDYPAGTLPVPEAPPRPELDRRHWITRAESPAA
jgi:hypothetical protein